MIKYKSFKVLKVKNFKIVWKKNKYSYVFVQVKIEIKMPKMAQFSKFEKPLALKQNFNGGQFHRETSKFGYFNNLLMKLR